MHPRAVTIVAFEGIQPLDVVGPYEVFAAANSLPSTSAEQRYAVSIVAPLPADTVAAGPLTVGGESGLRLAATPLPDAAVPCDTLLIPGGFGVYAARQNSELIDWIRVAATHARRVATVCTGSFLAAEAGLLDGRTVTTHWARADQLRIDYPAVAVDPDPIYLRDGDVWTSAGVTAGIDLALALVADDHGTEAAQTIARWLVMFMHRPGGQTQFATPVWAPRGDRDSIRLAQEAVESNPGGDHRLHVLAASVHMSVRHFARVFTDQVGEPPGAFVQRVRIEAARRQLERSSDTAEVIAAHVGFGTGESLRRAFHRQLGVSPDAYRRRFRTAS